MSTLGSQDQRTLHREHAADQADGPKSAQGGENGINAFQLRSYQLEMLDESMRRNIIVAVWNIRLLEFREAEDHLDGHWLREDIHVREGSK